MQLFNFFHTENASKQQKNGGFSEDLLSENDFEAVLVNFCCYKYGANVSEAVQKISTRALLELAVYYLLYWRYKPGFCFFLTNQNEQSLTCGINFNH